LLGEDGVYSGRFMNQGKGTTHRPRNSVERIALARFLAELLDQRFTIPGTSVRFGLDPILGLIPGIGDALANLAGSAILLIAAQYRLPKIVLLRMGLNVAFNALIGAVPIFGDVFSIWFRSNIRNAQLLERYVSAERQAPTGGDWVFIMAVILGIVLLLIGTFVVLVWLVKQLWNAM
jgi:Domain of unknown function (DUF4112)